MPEDIDIKSYAGELLDSAAESPQVVDQNSYEKEQEFPVHEELLDKPVDKAEPSPVEEEQPSKQELNFRALRDEVDRIKVERESERKEYQLQLDMLRANAAPRPPQAQQPQKMFDGMDDTEVPNVKEIRKAWQQQEAGYQARIEELEVARQFPDYMEVIDKFTIPLVKQDQEFAEGIEGASNKARYAYKLGKMAQRMQEMQAAPQVAAQEAAQKSENAQRIVANAKKPGTLSQAGGQGALSKADYFETMSDQEFLKFASKNLDG